MVISVRWNSITTRRKSRKNRSKTLSFIIVTEDSPAGTCHHSRWCPSMPIGPVTILHSKIHVADTVLRRSSENLQSLTAMQANTAVGFIGSPVRNMVMVRYVPQPTPKFDDRSTYLQFYLNGFSIDGTANRVIWKDFKSPEYGKPTIKTRRNVFQDKEKKIPCDWAFRGEDLLHFLREE